MINYSLTEVSTRPAPRVSTAALRCWADMINYSLTEVFTNCFCVVVEDSYDLGMLFCRAQEFYESPWDNIKSQNFNFFDFHKKYYSSNGECFTYPSDWVGFNMPLSTARLCYSYKLEYRTPYDDIFLDILSKIPNVDKGYIIGVSKVKSLTTMHELCHAKYYLDSKYREKVSEVLYEIKNTAPEFYKNLENKLIDLGYSSDVVEDEIHAYLIVDYNRGSFRKIKHPNKTKWHQKLLKLSKFRMCDFKEKQSDITSAESSHPSS